MCVHDSDEDVILDKPNRPGRGGVTSSHSIVRSSVARTAPSKGAAGPPTLGDVSRVVANSTVAALSGTAAMSIACDFLYGLDPGAFAAAASIWIRGCANSSQAAVTARPVFVIRSSLWRCWSAKALPVHPRHNCPRTFPARQRFAMPVWRRTSLDPKALIAATRKCDVQLPRQCGR